MKGIVDFLNFRFNCDLTLTKRNKMEEKPTKKGKEKKGTRDNWDQREKAIFWNILRTRNAGQIWKILTESSSNQAKHDAWVIVAQSFSGAISKDFTVDQARQLFKRLKDEKKKGHDRQIVEQEQQFRKHCSTTGGGPSSMPPPERDGDDDLHDHFDDMMDPVTTDYNRLVRPEHRIYPSSASARRPLGEISIQNSENLPIFSPNLSADGTGEATPMDVRSSTPTPSITPPPVVSPFRRNQNLPGVRFLGSRNPLNSNDSFASASAGGTRQVLIQDGNGNSRTVDAEEPVDTPRLPKRKIKKTMNDAAVSYYTKMSDVQTALAKQRMRVLKRKENVEILRQMLLERALQKEGVDIPEFGNIESSESDTDEDIETDV